MTSIDGESSDLAREQFFRNQPYQYSTNPFTHLATASWKRQNL